MQRRVYDGDHDAGKAADKSKAKLLREAVNRSENEKIPELTANAILAILVYNDKHGGILAKEVTSADFDPLYKVAIDVCKQYWTKYGTPPKGQFEAAIGEFVSPKKALEFGRLTVDVLTTHNRGVDGQFAIDGWRSFVERKKFEKATAFAAIGVIENPGTFERAREILRGFLSKDAKAPDGGLDMHRAAALLRARQGQDDRYKYTLGIEALDRHVALKAGQLLLMLAATGRGKTQFLAHVALVNALFGNNVLYVTLEMMAEDIWERLYQSALSTTLYDTKLPAMITKLDLDAEGRFIGLHKIERKPRESFDHTLSHDALAGRLADTYKEVYLNRIHVKHWPGGSITTGAIESYIEQRIAAGEPEPDIVLVDYAGKLKTSAGEKMLRAELQQHAMDLRNLGVKYRIPVVTAQQTNRLGFKANQVDMSHIAESAGMVHEADLVLAYSQDKNTEHPHGIARMLVDKQRRGRDKFWVLITQNYNVGLFAGDSAEFDHKLLEEVLKDLPSTATESTLRVTDEMMDKAVAALKATGKDRWQLNVRSPDWVGKAIAEAVGTDSNKRLADVVEALIKASKLVVFKGKKADRKDADFVRLASDDGAADVLAK